MEFSKVLKKTKLIDVVITKIVNLSIFLTRIFIDKNFKGKVIIISLHKLGDTVYTIPAIKNIKEKYKKIFILCFEDSIPIYKVVFDDIEFIALNKNDFCFSSRVAKHSARKKLKKYLPLIIFDLTGVMTSASLIFNSNAKVIIGFNRNYFKKIYSNFIEINNLFNNSINSFDIYLKAIESEVPNYTKTNEIEYNFDTSDSILIHPFSGWKSKEWGLNKFVELGKILETEYSCFFVVPDNSFPFEIKKIIEENGLKIRFTKSIVDLINTLSHCSMLISNDSGPIQIASLLGKPTYSIYGPSNPLFNLPSGTYFRYIQKKIKCSPVEKERLCFTEGGKYCPAYICLNMLTVDEVYTDLKRFIEELSINKIYSKKLNLTEKFQI